MSRPSEPHRSGLPRSGLPRSGPPRSGPPRSGPPRVHPPGRRGRRLRAVLAVLAGVALALAAGVAVPVPASAAPTAPGRYVALGDSFSAGVGTGRYDLAGASCLRSSEAYAPLLAEGRGTPLTFLACSGAKINEVIRHQIPKIPRDTGLVTVTMGGNDTGFSPVMTACTLAQHDETCRTAVRMGKAAAVSTVPVQLAVALALIRKEAPNARVVVLGYPRLFELGPCDGYVPDEARRRDLNAGTDLLDKSLATVSRAMGARFVDVRSRFAGHGVCAPAGQAWINGPGRGTDTYHPNAEGYRQGYLAALASVTG